MKGFYVNPISLFLFLLLLSSFISFSFSFPFSFPHYHNYIKNSILSQSLCFFPSQSPTSITLINQACKITKHPKTCISSLSKSKNIPPNPTILQIIQASIGVSNQNLKTAQSMFQSILDSSKGNEALSKPAYSCLKGFSHVVYRTTSSFDALSVKKIKDARAWMGAALSGQCGCLGGLKNVKDTNSVAKTLSFLDYLIGLSSNALSMVTAYDFYGEDIALWKAPGTERDGFWERNKSPTGWIELKFPTNLKVDANVCKGRCSYKTIQDAVNGAPNNSDHRFVIYIKKGLYDEKVKIPFEKKNVVFLGDGMGKTIITGSLNVGQAGMTTTNSSTVDVSGDGFMATNITFQNTAGPDAHQAVAFKSSSDLTMIENCEFLGHQDTLYANSLRQYYKSCRIQGNVDFIFGNAAAIFEDCEILVAPRQLNPGKGETNAITAHGRNDPLLSSGFVFYKCSINGTKEYMKLYHSNPKVHKNFLGRPWKEYSRTVFIKCNLEVLIVQDGWMPWDKDFALKTLYYGEFENSGPGSNTSHRVSWSNQIPKKHINAYSHINFIQGDEWKL